MPRRIVTGERHTERSRGHHDSDRLCLRVVGEKFEFNRRFTSRGGSMQMVIVGDSGVQRQSALDIAANGVW